MRLKRLEMQGYKSFAGRTELVFPTGITAVVGPNGSGKSNIADAIRWVLGEQSMRSLRGKSSEDMIFSGGGRRARAGMAEALLTLDNEDNWLPVDFTEVTVGRRAYRSGESEYLLNGNRVRLRDLNDLLGVSGLSQRTYTVIGQGMVDTALSLRPQERRTLFEEAAGITTYRTRREEAAGRLEETARNIERVRDILGEIVPRLKRLAEQEARFQEYERISAHLVRLQRAWYGYHWGQVQHDLQVARERVQSLEEMSAARQAEMDKVSVTLNGLRRQQADLRAQLRDAYRRTADLHDRTDSLQRELAALSERSRLQAVQRDEALEELAPLQAQVASQQERLRTVQAQMDELRAQVTTHEQRVAALEGELNELRRQARTRVGQREQLTRDLSAGRARLDKLERTAAEARGAQTRLEAEQELLARMRQEADGVTQGTRVLLQSGVQGIENLFSRTIEAPVEWERAVEAALGSRVQALVVCDWTVVTAARKALGAGERAVLLPLDGQRQPDPLALTAAPRAADVVGCEERLRPLVEALLGRTLLVEDLTAARRLLAELPAGGQCVTRAGEVVSADGAVTIGSGGGMLARERAWREVPEKLAAARQRREEAEAQVTHAAQVIAAMQEALQEAEREVSASSVRAAEVESGPLMRARTDLAVARQALNGQRTLQQRESSDLDRLRGQLATRRRRAEQLDSERAAAEQRLAQLRQQGERFERELTEVRARIGPAEESLSRLGQEQERFEGDERQARERVQQLDERLSSARLEVARRQDRLGRLQERIQDDLGLVELEVGERTTAQSPLPLHPLVSRLPVVETLPEGIDDEIQRLKMRLRQIGPVNPNAPQEYVEVRERHQFLNEQVGDLESASTRLQEVIAELDGMMEQAFRETFDAVAVAFEEIFTRLFNGGTARIELTDPGDLNQTGVDIVARPPGKRPQGLALLSGGERTLTAVALIFAILRVRPTPFCVLDEVDAMLDESNVARFRGMLQDLSSETQFVIITHNRGTVEAADTVYGVSMGAEGISQIVSLRLEGKEVTAG